MDRTYDDEYILDRMDARLVPPDNRYPDCQCVVMLTEEHLYILEDNFDGTYERHIAIPTGDILSIEQEGVQPEPKKGSAPDSDPTPMAGAIAALFGGLLGALSVSRRGSGPAPIQYLRVLYRDEAGEERRLYCKEYGGSVKHMNKALQQYRERRVL